MTEKPASNWFLFQALCRVLGGQDMELLKNCISTGCFPQLSDAARSYDVSPALAVRCKGLLPSASRAIDPSGERLKLALHDNTVRNMQIETQALKLTRQLNEASITPLFLKGTIALLEPENEIIGFRKQADIDLLVRPEELEVACDVFLKNGYTYAPLERSTGPQTDELLCAASAIKISEAHHHLPPLRKKSYNCEVELHRHFLAKKFQRKTRLQPIFDSAQAKECHDARFLVPSIEYQMIHLILGKFVHDGHLARRTFPLREACDFVDLLNKSDITLDQDLIVAHCGPHFATVYSLVAELMAYTPKIGISRKIDVSSQIRLLQRRQNSSIVGKLFDTHARVIHLATSLAYSPGKLWAYLHRQVSRN